MISSSQNYHFSVMAEPTCQGDRKWMRKEAPKRDALAKIEEKVGLLRIMALKGEVQNSEGVTKTEGKKSNRQNLI